MSKDKNTDNKPEVSTESRRSLLKKGGIAAGGVALFAAGYGSTVFKASKGLATGSSGEAPPHATRGNSLPPEFTVDPVTHELTATPGQVISPSMCVGCWSICGVRVRVDTENNQALRVAGNPFHPLATTKPLPMKTSIREAFSQLAGEAGIESRATACARGSSMIGLLDHPQRVTRPLKRVGKRGEGKWKEISFEQLIQEVCHGGDLFGEGQVDGLQAINDNQTLIDEHSPEFGAISNQFLFTSSTNEGREPLIVRFTKDSFGSMNYGNHGSYCGQSYRIGIAATLGEFKDLEHTKPDFENTQFALFIGTAPAQAGNPFQRQGRQLAENRVRKNFEYVVVTPVMPASMSYAVDEKGEWVGVKPAGDLALVLGMIRWIIENKRYNEDYLRQPGVPAIQAKGQMAYSNASHLLIADPKHPRFGLFLRASELGLDAEDQEAHVVLGEDGALYPQSTLVPVVLAVDQTLSLVDGQTVQVVSAFTMLSQHASEKTLSEYSELCGIPEEKIIDLARRFTSYGTQAVVNSHGGTMHGAGFYTSYAIALLNVLIGNINVKGGAVQGGSAFGPLGKGPRYNFVEFEGKKSPKGVMLSRNRFPYEKTSEFARKKEAGQNPYPATAPWYPAAQPLGSEMVIGALNGYPYKTKVWFNHMANVVYAVSGLRRAMIDRLADPTHVPLFVCIEPFINETSMYADYIVPDTVTYESWGVAAPWAGVFSKASTVRWPVVESKNAKTAEGETINVETFMIAVANELGLPGYGKQAIKDSEGELHDLNSVSELYLKAFANIAFAGVTPVPDASDEDMALTGVDKYLPALRSVLKEDEWRKAAFVMTRGGRFAAPADAWQDDQLKTTFNGPLHLWNEDVSKLRSSFTGQRFFGTPRWVAPHFMNGETIRDRYSEADWPLLAVSFKSNIMSSVSMPVDRLRQIHPHNPIALNSDDAKGLGIEHGDAIRVQSPYGEIHGVAMLRSGIVRGAVGIEHGYGHRALGAQDVEINGQQLKGNPALAQGVSFNDLGMSDTSTDLPGVWHDEISGAVVRSSVPVRVSRQ